ncbi:MAG: tetratricopeptide repeat protein [Gammaproteobacteria bacterium]
MPHHPLRRAQFSRAISSRLLRPFLVLVLMVVAVPARADSVEELRALVEAGDARAWDMAGRMESGSAGDADFDFWYGLAAKAAGKKNQAVFAFERVVASQPGNARAKLELADAYYQFGNTAEARALFEEVLASTPPDPVQQRIRTYLGAIDAGEKRSKTSVGGYVTVAVGHDSNINSATNEVLHDIPGIFIPLSLPVSALETDAVFGDLRAGIDIVQPVNQRHTRFFGASVQARDNEDLLSGGNYDYTQASLTGGWALQRGIARWRIPLAAHALRIEDDEARYLVSAGAEYNRPLSANTALSWFGQFASSHFVSQETRDTRQFLLGGAWSWSGSALRMTVSAHVGTEPAVESGFEYNGRDYVASRVNLRYPLSSRQSLYGALGVQQSKYKDVQPLLGVEREDLLVDAALGWQMKLGAAWTLNADVTHADNMSADNELFDFERTVAMLGATWRF